MTLLRVVFSLLLFSVASSQAQTPVLEAPLPELSIAERGELWLERGKFSFRPWSTQHQPAKVHIVQYFAGTKSDSELFAPFTDRLQQTFKPGDYHVTSIINLDAALWGTTGFVVSQVKKSKRKFPLSTLVLDAAGAGAARWQLGERGAGLFILDEGGIVRYSTRQTMSEEDIARAVDLVRAHLPACLESC